MHKNIKLTSLILTAALFLSACGQAAKPVEEQVTENAQDFPAVSVVEFGQDSDAFNIEKVGSVVAQKRANVFSETTGYVNNINVQIGDYVEEGEILATLADSTSTKLLEINKAFSAKDHSLALQILQSIQNSAQEDIKVMEQTVENAWLNYQTQLNNYSTNVDNLNQQVSAAKLALVQAKEAYQSLSETYEQSYNNYDINQDNIYETLFKQSQNALTHLQLALETGDLAYGQKNAKYSAIRGVLKNQIDYSTYIKADQLYLKSYGKLEQAQKKINKVAKDRSNDAYLDMADTILDLIDTTESVLVSGDAFLKVLSVSPAQGLDAQITQYFTKMGQDLASLQQDRLAIKQSLNGIDTSIGSNELQLTNTEGQLTQAQLKVKSASNALQQTQNNAQIQLNNLKSQIENSKNLYESSKAQLQGLKAKSYTQTLQSETSVNGVARQVATADAQLANKDVKSPLSGIVTAINVKEGNAVTTGQNVISIESPEETIVETTATEDELTSIAEGSQVVITNNNGEESEGYVSSINTFSGSNSLFKVQIAITNNNGLHNGTLVRLKFQDAEVTSGQFIPMNAVIFKKGHKSVYVINSDNIIEEREIKAGKIVNQSIEIESGLELGDRIAVEGARDLKPGDKVNASLKNYLPIPGQFDTSAELAE